MKTVTLDPDRSMLTDQMDGAGFIASARGGDHHPTDPATFQQGEPMNKIWSWRHRVPAWVLRTLDTLEPCSSAHIGELRRTEFREFHGSRS